jgi:hypothetical protein
METKEDELSTGRIWTAGFHYAMARSHLAGVLKLTNRLFLQFSNIFWGHGIPWVTVTVDNESVDMRAHLYNTNHTIQPPPSAYYDLITFPCINPTYVSFMYCT